MKDFYEVSNPEIQETLRGTAAKIGGALPKGWGFLLMLYEFGTEGHPGSTFYISNGDRKDCVTMLKDWLRRQGPDDVVNAAPKSGRELADKMTDEWHKVLAILMMKLNLDKIELTLEDVKKLAERPASSVAVGGGMDPNVLTVQLVTDEEARRLAMKESERHG